MNSNIFSQAQLLPSTDLGNATSATTFKDSAGTNPLLVYVKGSDALKHKCFGVRAAGRCTPGASSNLTIAIQHGTSGTAGSNTTLATTGAVAAGTAATSFFLEAHFFWDDTSGRLMGSYHGFVHGTVVAWTINTALTSSDPVTEGQAFAATGLWGTSDAGHVLILTTFEAFGL